MTPTDISRSTRPAWDGCQFHANHERACQRFRADERLATSRHWWTYPFLPFVDTWLEVFFRATQSDAEDPPRRVEGVPERPRMEGIAPQIASGLAPLVMMGIFVNVSRGVRVGLL